MRDLNHCQPWQNKGRFDLCLAAALHFCHDKTLIVFISDFSQRTVFAHISNFRGVWSRWVYHETSTKTGIKDEGLTINSKVVQLFLIFIIIYYKCRPKTSEVSIYHTKSRNQKSEKILPTIKKIPLTDLTITGKKSH